jgi:thioester reductase-like protein
MNTAANAMGAAGQKRVLLTGAQGFTGQHLVPLLRAAMPWFSWQQSAQDLFELVRGNPPPHLTARVSPPALHHQCLSQEESTP